MPLTPKQKLVSCPLWQAPIILSFTYPWTTIYHINTQQEQSSRGVPRKRCSEKCTKFIGEHPCRSAISIILKSHFGMGCCFATLLKSHFGMGVLLWICRTFSNTLFPRNTSGWLFLTQSTVLMVLSFDKNKLLSNMADYL